MNKLIVGTVLAAALTVTPAVFADEPDLILGFQDSVTADNTYNYEVDLGSASLFTALKNTGTTVNLYSSSTANNVNQSGATTSFGAVSPTYLLSLYSSADRSAGAVSFSVAGVTGSSPYTYYITDLSSSVKPQNGNSPSQTAAYGKIDGIYGEYDYGTVTAEPGINAENVLSSESGSYSSTAGSTGSYGGLASYNTQAVLPSSGSVNLNLYSAGVGSGNATLVGFFTMNSAGDLTFTGSSSAVPEPSTYLLLGIGLVGLYFGTRRKSLASV